MNVTMKYGLPGYTSDIRSDIEASHAGVLGPYVRLQHAKKGVGRLQFLVGQVEVGRHMPARKNQRVQVGNRVRVAHRKGKFVHQNDGRAIARPAEYAGG